MKALTRWLVSVVIGIGIYFGRIYIRSSQAEDGAKEDPATQASDDTDNNWELQDDSVLTATLEPWRAVAVPSTLHVELSADDSGRSFNGTFECRIANAETNSDPWYLVQPSKTVDGTTFFDFPVKLRPGTFWVQFRVKEPADKTHTELTDWMVVAK